MTVSSNLSILFSVVGGTFVWMFEKNWQKWPHILKMRRIDWLFWKHGDVSGSPLASPGDIKVVAGGVGGPPTS